MRRKTGRFLAVALSGLLLLSAASIGAVAGGEGTNDHDGHDVKVQGGTITIQDTHVTGEGLPSKTIEHREFTIDAETITIDGLTVTVDGKTHEIGKLSITIEDVGIVLENVSTGPPK